MTPSDIYELLGKDEDEHVEFKEAKSSFDSDKLAEYAVALANEHGGMLILGVTDKKPHKIVGTKAYMDGMAKIKEQLIAKIQMRIDVDEVQCSEGRVLVFHIPSRPIGVPKHLNGRYLMRAGEGLTSMPPDMLKRIFDESGPDFTAEVCKATTLNDLDPVAIEDFRKRWANKSGNSGLLHLDREQLLLDAELIVGKKLTYAALILFGTHTALGRFLGQAEVIFEYRASNATGPAQQRIDFRQGFFSFYDRLWEPIDLRHTNQHYQDGLFIWDIKTFNDVAIRDEILNAVSHRDYRDPGSVFVRQYPERIEIVSPGGLPPGITFENILWEQAPRNRRLAEAFARCGLVERAGQGMNRIFESCIRESKQVPDFTNSDDYHFWITLHGDIQHPEFLRILERIGRERVLSFSLDDFIVLQAVFEERPIQPRFAGSLHMLLDEGIIEKRAGQRKKTYVLSRRLYAAIGKPGVHTRKAGLDKDTNKELLLKHIRESEPKGAKMEEFLQVLPALNRRMIQTLLYALRKEGRIYCSGARKGARWHIETGGKI
jgi:ATP-dependent DNA helicase RecG